LNKFPNDVPAHRMVNKQSLHKGKIHFDGINLMQDLLENDGVEIKYILIIDLESFLWEPKI